MWSDCWRSKNEVVSDLVLWEPKRGKRNVRGQARTFCWSAGGGHGGPQRQCAGSSWWQGLLEKESHGVSTEVNLVAMVVVVKGKVILTFCICVACLFVPLFVCLQSASQSASEEWNYIENFISATPRLKCFFCHCLLYSIADLFTSKTIDWWQQQHHRFFNDTYITRLLIKWAAIVHDSNHRIVILIASDIRVRGFIPVWRERL